MKKLYNILIVSLMVTSVGFYSCETVELEDLASPNALSTDQADPDLLLNSIQLQYRNNQTTFNNVSSNLSRITVFQSRNYLQSLDGGTLDGVWSNVYSGMVPNLLSIQEINAANADIDLSFHEAVAKTLIAHNLMELVDWLGDIPWTEANRPFEFPSPNVDDDASVYAAALTLLDEAAAQFASSSGPGESTDFYYGDKGNNQIPYWIKLVNTLKMRADLTQGNYAAVMNATNVIDTEDSDFQFDYGTNALTPDTRHPDYINDYRSDGANIYQSNWLINLMVGTLGDLGSTTPDPRRRYYFYRQNWGTPGSRSYIEDVTGFFGPAGAIYFVDIDPNGETLSCSLESAPPHIQFTPDEAFWCGLRLGYWGRQHGDAQGIPPDNFTRTASGVYPAGGSFDNNQDAYEFFPQFDSTGAYIGLFGSINSTFGQQVGLGSGGGGAGIEPIYLAAYVDFMKAEAALASGNAPMAATYMEAGMTKHIAKVQTFGSLDPAIDTTVEPDAATVADFIAERIADFNAAPTTPNLDGNGYPIDKTKMDILGEQYFVTLYGGAADAVNFIRRTGHPQTLTRSLEPASGMGTFPRTILYPNSEIVANPNITQRTDLNTLVFWDSGVTNPAN
jgi:hypothetical protein